MKKKDVDTMHGNGKESSVAILLASYNGERFISEQIESIRTQSFQNWNLFIRDDGSSDQTIAIIQDYISEDHRIHLLQDDLGCLGVSGNFNCLMEHVLDMHFSYFCLADQDDVWLPSKFECQVKAIQEIESSHLDSPLLVHSDLQVVAEDLSVIHSSYLRFRGVCVPNKEAFRMLAVQNYVTGCTIMFNHRLLQISVPMPMNIRMHDWWLAYCAAIVGEIFFLPEQLVLYRQHGHNVLGAIRGKSQADGVIMRWKRGQQEVMDMLSMSEAIIHHLDAETLNRLPSRDFLRQMSKLSSLSGYRRIRTLLKLGVYRCPRLLTLILYARVLFLR